MRTIVLLVAAVILTVSALPAASAPVAASTIPVLSITIEGLQNGTAFQFSPSQILLPQVPIILNVTFYNNQSVASGVPHTFTINNNAAKPVINSDLKPQENATFQFTVNSLTNITYNGTSFTPEAGPTGGIRFYCVYHQPQMVGEIVLAGAPSAAGQEQKGMFLRAYWMWIIGIAAMLVWVGISYFIIKGSTPRFKDHKEHVRKGLP
ncbi:MAG TPA: hypothetical protein HA326_05570 [Thermoplasmata archaeon]|nr:hypothetical protein [Thermoplasmata archaeon]